MSALDRRGFVNYGQGYYGLMIAVHTAPTILANLLNVNLIIMEKMERLNTVEQINISMNLYIE